jgi:hypothetical protein
MHMIKSFSAMHPFVEICDKCEELPGGTKVEITLAAKELDLSE